MGQGHSHRPSVGAAACMWWQWGHQKWNLPHTRRCKTWTARAFVRSSQHGRCQGRTLHTSCCLRTPTSGQGCCQGPGQGSLLPLADRSEQSRYILTYIHTYMHSYIHIYIHTYIHTSMAQYLQKQPVACQDDVAHGQRQHRGQQKAVEAPLRKHRHLHQQIAAQLQLLLNQKQLHRKNN